MLPAAYFIHRRTLTILPLAHRYIYVCVYYKDYVVLRVSTWCPSFVCKALSPIQSSAAVVRAHAAILCDSLRTFAPSQIVLWLSQSCCMTSQDCSARLFKSKPQELQWVLWDCFIDHTPVAQHRCQRSFLGCLHNWEKFCNVGTTDFHRNTRGSLAFFGLFPSEKHLRPFIIWLSKNKLGSPTRWISGDFAVCL